MEDIHAIKRAKERYGLDLTKADLAKIVTECKAGRALLCRAPKHTPKGDCFVYMLRYMGVRLVAVIDRDYTVVITFQPHDYCNGGEQARRTRRNLGKKAISHARVKRERRVGPRIEEDWE